MATDQIDELIEESYLLSLPEQDIRTHLRMFLDACEIVLKQDMTTRRDLRIVGVKVALLRAKFLLNANKKSSQNDNPESPDNAGQQLIQQVMQTKRLIRRLLGGVDAALVHALDREEKRLREEPSHGTIRVTLRSLVRAAGYYVMLISIFLMLFVYLRQ